MNLSKSRYCKGIQCPKMLWMMNHKPELFDESTLRTSVLETGNAVGDLAMGYYGEFVEVAFREHGKVAMLEDTWEYMRRALEGTGPENIAEASFDYQGNFCSVDILRVGYEGVHLVEVKSSTSLRPIYLHDMAYQTWVLTQLGIKVLSVSLMHLNSSYVRQGDLDLQQLFAVEDHTEEVMAMLPEISERVTAFKELADQGTEPACEIGEHCMKPYECGFRSWCWNQVPTPSVFDLNRVSTKKAAGLRQRGTQTFLEVLDSGMKLSYRQWVQVRAQVQNLDTIVEVPAVRQFLEGLQYPLYFLDFETIQPAVPLFEGTRPFQQIPTQYSLHVVAEPGGVPEHFEFLAQAGEDPRRSVAEHLVAGIPEGACTLAYNMSFEKGRIAEMADAYPDLADHLRSIADGMQDLMKPFVAGQYYAKAMGGSNSIKAVLPALFPDDPELDYHALEGVQNGSEAMDAFEGLADLPEDEAQQVRQQLLTYCQLDTWAMVKLWQRLCQVAGLPSYSPKLP